MKKSFLLTLAYIWASPLIVFGFIAFFVLWLSKQVEYSQFIPKFWIFKFWFVPDCYLAEHFNGMSIGSCIAVRYDLSPDHIISTTRHESYHVLQGYWLGVLFPILYAPFWASIMIYNYTGVAAFYRFYAWCPFERAANRYSNKYLSP